jgi:hypothetical protein
VTLPELVRQQLPKVENFIEVLSHIDDDDRRSAEYRRISKLVRFAQRFYEAFFNQEFGIEVTSFTFHDKRVVADEVTDAEEERSEQPDPDGGFEDSRLDLAYRYLEICDQLHGELEFGYSLDDADFVVFHEETFPDWLDEVGAWMQEEGSDDLVERIGQLSESYRDAVS